MTLAPLIAKAGPVAAIVCPECHSVASSDFEPGDLGSIEAALAEYDEHARSCHPQFDSDRFPRFDS